MKPRGAILWAGVPLGALALLWALLPSPAGDAGVWPVSPALADKNGRVFHVRLSSAGEFCLPVKLERMGKWLPLVAVEVEDRRFYSHPGVDALALLRAVWQNITNGRVISGASTISSQTIRLLWPGERSLAGKAREFALALKLELALTKREILETYLNRAPFGGTVRGVEAAARSYFGKRAEELSLAEAALLIGMLRGPSLYRPDKNPEKTLRRRNDILNRLRRRNVIPASELELALLEPLPPGRGNIPRQAWHYADLAFRSLPADYWSTARAPVRTAFDPVLQGILELRLDEALLAFPEQVTAAGGVVDNQSGALAAYVGNARFSPGVGRQWVDCGASLRSPGSLLKPFVYLLAYEQGKLVPASLLADTPLAFSGDAPRNYDRLYRGPVTAGQALAASLNAPAVRVLRLVGGEAGRQFMRRCGLSGINRSAAYYGDSLTLGGCETTLLQILDSYSTLARLGLRRQLTTLAEKAGQRPGEERVATQAGAWLIAESLRDTLRLPPAQSQSIMESGRPIAFKTGTSYGFRDAWTAAYTPRHTAAVWLGDPAGLPHSGLVGLIAAAPAALAVLRDIPPAPGEKPWYDPPSDMESFMACTLSGMPAAPGCPQTAWKQRIRGVTPAAPCSLHTLRDGELRTILPAELETYVHRKNIAFARRPRLEITAPLAARYFISPEAPVQNVALTVEGARGTVYWFLNERFFGAQAVGQSLLLPLRPGKYVLSMVDEEGRSARTVFHVADIMERRPRIVMTE
ncbi:MAG: penicillin-binding protein 1C [Desulfovibrio sp.]|jgi:penicillin-binding protein 1C|nr:penicillin-binding protein 1C [Desulfovibrio sp.]